MTLRRKRGKRVAQGAGSKPLRVSRFAGAPLRPLAIGIRQASFITVDWDFWELLWPQVFRGVGLMLSMAPINNLALGTMPPMKIKNASGLFNVMRNLGGAFGLAVINTLLDKRMDLHLERLR